MYICSIKLINEELTVRAWNTGKDAWLIDYISTQSTPIDSGILLEAYRYGGGIGFRATEKWTKDNCFVLTSEGNERDNADGTKARWCIVTGIKENKKNGILFMDFPQNREFPEPMRVWLSNSIDNKGYFFFEFCPIRHISWKMERRKFIRNAVAGAAGTILLPAVVPSSVFGKGSPNDKINVGVIGCGRISRAWDMPGVMKFDSVRMVAVCYVDSNRMADAKTLIENYYEKNGKGKDYIDVKMYGDYKDLLQNKDIDAVIITTPDHWHAQPAIEAALAGKDIYLEKPTALTVNEGRLLSDIVRREGVILQMGTQQRSMPQFRIAAELVRNGRIGRLHTVKIGLPGDPSGPEAVEMPVPENLNYDMWLGSTPEVYYTEMGVHPQKGYSRPGWLRREQFGSGMITGWGQHHFDSAAWGMDTGIPVTENEIRNAVENELTIKYPGVKLIKESDNRFYIDIPQKYKVGHEGHFRQVTEKYLEYLQTGELPAWEIPNMITKYYITTTASKMARGE